MSYQPLPTNEDPEGLEARASGSSLQDETSIDEKNGNENEDEKPSSPRYLPCITQNSTPLVIEQAPMQLWSEKKESKWRICLKITKTALRAIAPSFLLSAKDSKTLHPTAYLDGIRGVAALIVCFDHSILSPVAPPLPHTSAKPMPRSIDLFNGYASGPGPDDNKSLIQLPILRILFGGRGMVAVFFVVSGFCLSLKPLSLRNSREPGKLLNNLASSVFRRGFRLYIPVLAMVIMTQIMAFFCIGNWIFLELSLPDTSFIRNLEHVWNVMVSVTNPLHMKTPPNIKFYAQLWTIPTEFLGSFAVFLTILGLANVRNKVRIGIEIFLTGWCFYVTYWELCLFIGGVVLAEVHVLSKVHTARSCSSIFLPIHQNNDERRVTKRDWARTTIYFMTFFISLYLLSQPSNNCATPSYAFLCALMPQSSIYERLQEWFWLCPGALLLVFSIGNLPLLQNIFTSRFAQFLGRISYAIYLIHFLVIFTIKDILIRWVWGVMGLQVQPDGKWVMGAGSRVTGYFLGGLVLWPVVFWVADLFERAVDRKAVKFARWIAQRIETKD
jgi:peptidoglycan/LPS O-acetylase OafA/YrhL